jgi:NAD(P)H-dependent FMN reductase
MIIVSSPFKQSFRREMLQSPRQNVRGNSEVFLEFIEFAQPLEGVSQDQDAPPVTDAFQRSGCGTFG